jgi:predicted DNA-binding transcriptional regulator YafY
MTQSKRVKIDYTNWRGERSERFIRPLQGGFHFTVNQWHREPQWLVQAVDEKDGKVKTFAMNNIHKWSAA